MKTNTIQILSLALIFSCMSSFLAAQSYSGGNGIPGDPYLIGNKNDLKYLSENSGEWSKDFRQIADIVFDASDFQSGGLFYNGGLGFIPIGNTTVSFDGSYDGNGKTISGLYINRPALDFIGFFGLVNMAQILNVNLIGVDISGNNYVGGLVGYNAYSPVTSCHVTGTVNATSMFCGGLIGQNYPYSHIGNSYSTAEVNGTYYVGGLIGNNSLSNISGSFSTGNVSGIAYVGGFIGLHELTPVSNCYARGNVVRASGTETRLGGFVGWMYSGSMQRCYSTGTVSGAGWTPVSNGFAGAKLTGTFSYNYWDIESSGQPGSAGAVPGELEGKTTAQMKQQATFVTWDFTNTWHLSPASNNGYPYLMCTGTRKYVTVAGAGTQTGNDWANALPGSFLQAAINDPCATEVWVAAGTYHPTLQVTVSGYPFYTFQMRNGVAIYGGFAGTETDISQRTGFGPGGTNESILSGDMSDNDVYSGEPWEWQNLSENSFHVLYLVSPLNLNNTAILDGFTIKGGYANNPYGTNSSGGGIHISQGTPILNNLAFVNNFASAAGAIYISNASPVVNNTIFNDNFSYSDGGAIYLQNAASPVFTNCLITNNISYNNGAGIMNNSSGTGSFINTTLAYNHALNGRGGGVYQGYYGGTYFQNSIIWGNLSSASSYPGHQIFNYSSITSMVYSCFSNGPGDTWQTSGAIMWDVNTIQTDPFFVDALNGDYRIKGTSPCADAGNDAFNALTTDIRGNDFGRKLLKTNYLDDGPIDMGAYEYNSLTDPIGCINQPPIAHAGGPYTCDLHSSITLDGTGSSDPNTECGDEVVAWHWDLDEDEDYDDASGPAPLIPPSQIDLWGPGTRPVAVRVTDSFGATSTASTTLDIYDNRPFPVFTIDPDPACSGQPVQFDGSGSYHGKPGKLIVSYEWDFDYQTGNFSPDGTGEVIYHPFPTGNHTVALRVTDDNDPPKSQISSQELIVNPVPDFDIVVHASQPVCGGALVEFSASVPPGNLTYAWEFVDATPVGPTNGFTSKAIAPNTCTGTFTATCTVTDADGDCESTESVIVPVEDLTLPEIVSPSAIRVNNDPGECGASIAYDGFLDPGTDPFDDLIGDDCNYAGNGPADYPGTDVILRKPVIFSEVPQPIPPLNVGEQAEIGPFLVESFFDVYTDPFPVPPPPGTWDPASAPGTMKVKVTLTAESSDTRFYETEMVQLDLSGGTLPPGMMLRESPTLVSTGKLKIQELSPGGPPYRIDSFFDIFTEISVDGGSTWKPASVPLHVSRFTNTTGPTVAYHDNCSAPGLVQTKGLPSGSLFPVGITVNTFEVTDVCGKTSSTSFEVIVTDNEAPQITCPPAVTKHMNSGCTYVGAIGNASATDNCTNPVTNTWNDAPAAFPEGNTTVNWYAQDASGNTSSCPQIVTVVRNSISGTVKYHKAYAASGNIPLNGVTLTLLDENNQQVGDPFTTSNDGQFSFTDLCGGPATYTIQVSDNQNDIGGFNSTDAVHANSWFANPSAIGPLQHVRFLAGDVSNNFFINTSDDAINIQKYFIYDTEPPRVTDPEPDCPWAYWKVVSGIELISSNYNPYGGGTPPVPWPTIMTVTINNADVTCDILALVVGDMNTSFIPAQGNRGIASETLLLTYGETRLADAGQEVEIPVRLVNSSELTAMSLILDYPAELLVVTEVSLILEIGNLDWRAKNGELRIGWNSLTPLWLEANSLWLTIHGRTTESFGEGDEIRLALAPDLLNELADGNNNVIQDARLETDIMAFSTTGTWNPEPGTWNGLTLDSRPNPFSGYSILDYGFAMDGHVTLEITDMLGRRVALLVDERQTAGEYSVKLDATPLQPGVYMATLRLDCPQGDLVKTIKLVRER